MHIELIHSKNDVLNSKTLIYYVAVHTVWGGGISGNMGSF